MHKTKACRTDKNLQHFVWGGGGVGKKIMPYSGCTCSVTTAGMLTESIRLIHALDDKNRTDAQFTHCR